MARKRAQRANQNAVRAPEPVATPVAEPPRHARACSFVARQVLVFPAMLVLAAALQWAVDVPYHALRCAGTRCAQTPAEAAAAAAAIASATEGAWKSLRSAFADGALCWFLLAFARWRGAPRPGRAELADGALVALSYAFAALVTRLRGLMWTHPRAELCGAAVALLCWRASGASRQEIAGRWSEPWLAGWCALRALAAFGHAPTYVIAATLFGLHRAWGWFKSLRIRT
jgi:hypothetical protein